MSVETGRRPDWREWALLAAIVVLAIVLRVHALGQKSLWLDEILFARSAWGNGELLAPFGSAIGAHPPGYLFVVRLALLAGRSEAWLRLPALLAAVAGIPALWMLGRALLGPAVGLLAALLLATFPLHVGFSQEVHSYALFATLSTLSLWALHRAARREAAGCRSRDWPGAWLPFVLFTALNLYTHYYAAFPAVLSLPVFLLLLADLTGRSPRQSGRRPLIHLVLALGLILLLYLPQLLWGLGQSLQHADRRAAALAAGEAQLQVPDLPVFLDVAVDRLQQDPLALVAGSVLLLVGLAWLFFKRRWLGWALSLWLLLPLPLIIWLGFEIGVSFRVRRLAFALPVALLVVVVALPALATLVARLWARARRNPPHAAPRVTAAITLVLALAVSAALMASLRDYYRTPKQDWRTVAAILAAHAGPRDVVLAQAKAAANLAWYYPEPVQVLERGFASAADSLCATFQEVYLLVMQPNEPLPRDDSGWLEANAVRISLPLLDLYYRNCSVDAWVGAGADAIFAMALQPDLPYAPTAKSYDSFRRRAAAAAAADTGRGNVGPEESSSSSSDEPVDGSDALSTLRALVEAVPEDRSNRMDLAAALAEQGYVEEALAEYGAISERWPGFPWAYIRQGELLESMDDLPAAVEAYEAAVQVGPDNAFAHIQLAYAYLHSGRPQDAMRAFEQGLALDPTRVAAREALERLRAEQP